MYKILSCFLLISSLSTAQTLSQKLNAKVENLLKSNAAYSANLSFYVADEAGNKIYDYNATKGLSTASTQKIFTAACALETLGKNYQFTTSVSFNGELKNEILNGDLVLFSNGDPTLGSWRYNGYQPDDFKAKLIASLQQKGIKKIMGNLVLDDSYFDMQTIPGGWPWNDLGNYYGAGVWGVNWRENQFDLNVKGDKIIKTNVDLPGVQWVSELNAGGSSDQSLIFTAPHSDVALINGMLPAGKLSTVSGAMPNPPLTLGNEIRKWLTEAHIELEGQVTSVSQQKIKGEQLSKFSSDQTFFNYQSPTLDKIIYWFMRKSVNLYGETMIKTLAREQKKKEDFGSGLAFLKSFWEAKGIHPKMINFGDGSGLSPQNYVSSLAEVQALLYAKKQTYFPEFFAGFPEQNGMRMKSGSMKNTKSFAGYHNGYVFSIIINNYQGNDIRAALYNILNVLK